MTKNNFNIPNYIHLSYQGYLDDKMNTKKNLQLKTALKQTNKIVENKFKSVTGLSVTEYLKYASNEAESMQAMIALFSGDLSLQQTNDGKSVPFSKIWDKYSEQVERKIENLNLTSEEKNELLNYTGSVARVTNISAILKLLREKNSLKDINNFLVNITSDFDEDLLNEFQKQIKISNSNDWAHLLINQATREALTMTKSLDKLENVKKTYTFGQLLGNEYNSLIKDVNDLNKLYSAGASASTIRNKVNKIVGILNRKIKGTGSETISFLNIPIIKEKIGEVSIDLVHTGLVGDIKDFNNTIEFTRAKSKTSKEIMSISGSRNIKLADVTMEIKTENDIKKIGVSRKMRNLQAKEIIIGGDITIAQANAMIMAGGFQNKFNFLNNQYAFTFYNAMNFFLMRKNMWYKTNNNTMYLTTDNAKNKRAMGKFSSLKSTQETLNNEIISSFLGATYASFFTADFVAFYDINNFIVPSPLLFKYSIDRITSQELSTGITNFVTFGSSKKDYEDSIRNNGSGEKGIFKSNKKYFPFQLMALKRNKAAVEGINNCKLNIKSYNITNKEYYYDMFNKYKNG